MPKRFFKRRAKTLMLKALTKLPSVAAEVACSPFVLLWDSLVTGRRLKRHWRMRFVAALVIGSALLCYAMSLPQRSESLWLERRQTDFSPIRGVPYADLINKWAKSAGLSPPLVAAVIRTESSFDASAVSDKGAKGLMQLMPGTWAEVMAGSGCTARHSPPARGSDCIFEPGLNIAAGTRYLSRMIKACGGKAGLGLIAYNAGLGNVNAVEARIGKGDLSGETAEYVAKVYSAWDGYEGPLHDRKPYGFFGRPIASFILALNCGLWLIALFRIGMKLRGKI